MDLSWTVDRAGDASLVRCRLRNDDAVPRRVRVESRFDAPVLPPRRAGAPADGWDASGVTLRIGPGERRGFGFAVPALPVDPPVAIADVESVEPAESGRGIAGSAGGDGDADSTPIDALRDLPEHRPPRAAVHGESEVGGRGDDAASGGIAREPDPDPDGAESDGPERDGAESDGPDPDDAKSDDPDREVDESRQATPDAVDDWFVAVEARVDRAERLTDADVAGATEVVAEAGGVDGLAGLDERLDADAERLRAVSERAAALAERAAATDAPIEALERLA